MLYFLAHVLNLKKRGAVKIIPCLIRDSNERKDLAGKLAFIISEPRNRNPWCTFKKLIRLKSKRLFSHQLNQTGETWSASELFLVDRVSSTLINGGTTCYLKCLCFVNEFALINQWDIKHCCIIIQSAAFFGKINFAKLQYNQILSSYMHVFHGIKAYFPITKCFPLMLFIIYKLFQTEYIKRPFMEQCFERNFNVTLFVKEFSVCV